MVFSSLIFLFAFLPIVLAGNFLLPLRGRNYFLLLASWLFFAWGGVSYSAILIGSILCNYLIGLALGRWQSTQYAKVILGVGVGINLAVIGYFKYIAFLLENLNSFFDLVDLTGVAIPKVLLPVGISFYTFQAISYLVDVYRREVPVQKSFFDLALYISLFPQLIAGPIIRYHDIVTQLKVRDNSLGPFIQGVERFTIGLAKKVLIANHFAMIADKVFDSYHAGTPTLISWMGIIAYTFQIYFDFSGYSDMAIGLGRMFGFKFCENFNHPYIARSIKDFWRRWHISLSTWFRDYLYIPLGGNRVGIKRTYFNLLIVFFLTGLWHGASWNFIVWGLFHGMFLVLERLGFGKVLNKLPRIFQHIYTLLIVMIAWVFFRAADLSQGLVFVKNMFGYIPVNQANWIDYYAFINYKFGLLTLAALLLSMPVLTWIKQGYQQIEQRLTGNMVRILDGAVSSLILASVIMVLFITTMLLNANSYNPFIYFRF